MVEHLVRKLEALERHPENEALNRLHEEIDNYRSKKLEPRYKDYTWTRKSALYFHSIQDLFAAKFQYKLEDLGLERRNDLILGSQACFVQNLDDYVSLMPDSEDPGHSMLALFQLILRVGKSADWREDRELVEDLHSVYRNIDNTIIQPWVIGNSYPSLAELGIVLNQV